MNPILMPSAARTSISRTGLGDVATEGQGTVVIFHYGRGEKTPMPDELRRRIAELEASVPRA